MKKTSDSHTNGCPLNDVEYNYNHVQELLTQSLSESPDIIVLPETWNTGFIHLQINQYRR